jgi:hypothetical protein
MHSIGCGDARNTSRHDSSASRWSCRSPRNTRRRSASMPNTTRPMFDQKIAPAHITQGSPEA